MERKFKVGDKVRFIGSIDPNLFNADKLEDHRDDLCIMGDIDTEDRYQVGYTMGVWRYWWYLKPEDLVLIEFTKDSLQPGDVVTLRNGDKLILDDDKDFIDIFGERSNSVDNIEDFTANLEYKFSSNEYDSDIMKVERPTYHTVYERVEEKKEPKKMTVAEISKELGYDVEIVKG